MIVWHTQAFRLQHTKQTCIHQLHWACLSLYRTNPTREGKANVMLQQDKGTCSITQDMTFAFQK